ncbi:hypothetical protein B7486_58345 [cyanobacterium TDX16]|nr:hypothetical protein B7486_58345 [cyanobacterium TDX16]
MATMPTHEQLEAFLAGPADQPVVMLNMLTFKAQADPPYEGMTGMEVTLQYSRAMKEHVEAHGASYVLGATVDSQLIGEGGEHFEFVGIMRYPSREAYLGLAGDPEVAATIGRYRDAGLEGQWLFALTEVEA